ncbi:GAF and ANTAR domain-containing protein [Aeromicrobium sp. Leaf350]|uniref:GAF and ANTAR domain-containing protein n=1 Tax=Aeromicrobium sp. Leaf350 TaxID=2876565 RepID=UPI001E53DDFB|nr:GAF and ANTAR domain-containing protein [Aeromicrobium sp. Leaf350]
MDVSHEHLLAQLAVTLVNLRDTTSLPLRLCQAARTLLDAEGTAMTLSTLDGIRLVVAATDDLASALEDVQDLTGEGPSFAALDSGVLEVAHLGRGSDADEPWPLMRARSSRLGFMGALLAIPLKLDDQVMGVLSARRSDGPTSTVEQVGSFLGTALTAALLQDAELGLDPLAHPSSWPAQAEIHQATGMVVAQVGVLPEDAMSLLRGHAFAQDTTLADVAGQVIAQQISFRHFTVEGD